MQTKQAGFSVVILIALIVMVVGLVGWGVWRVYNEQSSTDTNAKTYQQIEQVSSEGVQTETLKIEELGIEIALSSEIKDITFALDLSNEQYPKASFSTQNLTDMESTCAAEGIAPPLGMIIVTQETTDESGMALTTNTKNVLKLNNTFVILKNPQSPCSNNQQIEDEASQKRQLFTDDFMGIELIK